MDTLLLITKIWAAMALLVIAGILVFSLQRTVEYVTGRVARWWYGRRGKSSS